MGVVGWASPVGLAIFMVALGAMVVLLCIGARIASGNWFGGATRR